VRKRKRRIGAVDFEKGLDRALLEDMLWVEDSAGKMVQGSVSTGNLERRWRFAPAEPWKASHYALTVDMALEDPCGNTIGRAFEVDQTETVSQRIATEKMSLPFEVRPVAGP
jgi:hypothetical protein